MASGGTSTNIRDHGVVVDKKKGRVRCNYCKKEMSAFIRLKRHLSGIRMEVAPCEEVPEHVRETFRCMVLEECLVPGVTSAIRSGNHQECGRNIDSFGREGSSDEDGSLLGVKRGSQTSGHDMSSRKFQKSIGQFFFENGLELSAVSSPSFREMLSQYRIPSFQDMSGWILQEERQEMEEYVKRIKDSWEITGCSILLDAWVGVNGRELVTFIADCPEGAVYLRSCDVSHIKDDMLALMLLVDEIVEDVGAHNVVQIISCSVSGWVGELGQWFARRGVFWSLSVSQCFELILERIGKTDVVFDVLKRVKNVFKFIHSDPSVLNLFRDHNRGKDLSGLSKRDSVAPYLTLESIVTSKKSLTAMFASSAWKNMSWASREEGITVARLMEDSAFWSTAETVLKCTTPLVRGLFLFARDNKPQVGHIYDTMDEIKEIIKKEVSRRRLSYRTFWNIIDEVWDMHLHSPLHAAGYFLNPLAFYSTAFHLDPEVATGLLSSLICLVQERSTMLNLIPQLEMYRLGKDSFFEASRVDKITGIAPAEWWARYADRHPELQRVAIKILSQTCEGASKYRLKRSVAEQLFAVGKSPPDEQCLKDFAFVHYNMHLRQCKLGRDTVDPMDDAAACGSATD